MAQLLVIGVTISVFTALFLVSRRNKALHDVVLAVWLVAMAIPIFLGLVMRNFPDLQIPVLPHLIYPLSFGPFMWIYVSSLTGDIRRLDQRHLLHFAPFVVASLAKNLSGWPLERPTPMMETFSLEIRIAGAVNLAFLLVYSIAVFRRLRLHGSEVLEHFSALPSRVTLIWLRWIAAGITGTYLLLFIGCVVPLPKLLIVHIVMLTGVILVLCFFGLRQTQLYALQKASASDAAEYTGSDETSYAAGDQPNKVRTQRKDDLNDAKPSYSRSGLTDERAEVISRRLEDCMAAEKPYLDPELTIETLAKQIAVPRRHLTQVINERYEMNFFAFINGRRIQAVKEALKSPDNNNRTLLEIAYESGFNSKSTFNTAFKQNTGMTPSQFRAWAT